MPHSEAVLQQQLFNYANQTSESMNSGVTKDTIGYRNAVKVALRKVWKDYHDQTIDIRSCTARVKLLLRHHPHLLLEINSFMPEKHQITLASLEDSRALEFILAVKLAIQHNFHDFRKVLEDYHDQTIDIRCFTARVKLLLRHHPHLLLELNSFMPEKHQITLVSLEHSRALDFILAVKLATQHKRENNFHDFQKALKDYGDQTIDIRCLISRVKALLRHHPHLLLEFNFLMPKKHQITLASLEDSRALDFILAVKLAIQHKRENNYHDFQKVLKDYDDQTIDLSCLTSRVKVLLKNHPDLILEFNTFIMQSHSRTGEKLKDSGHFGQLPWDMLDTICKTLDFDDLFSFSGVCKNWRTFHKSNFVSSQEPLLVRIVPMTRSNYTLISIPNQKVYDLKMMNSFQPPNYVYVRASSGYFILAHKDNSFLLINPFTRKKMVINATFPDESLSLCSDRYEALLAFERYSEEYVLVVLCKESSRLYVYRSRSYGWFTYSTLKPKEVVVDFVVLNNIIYVVTDKASIGVLNLNSGNIQFLNLKNTPNNDSSYSFRLVNCDEQLLVFHSISSYNRREVYKIDLSTMNYVKMKTLGDIALFYVSWRNCWALSNPKRFGFESNHVYQVSGLYQCIKYDWNDGCLSKVSPYFGYCNPFDWYFRHVKYEVDYSLVE